MENWDFMHFYTYFYSFEKSKFQFFPPIMKEVHKWILTISEKQVTILLSTMSSGFCHHFRRVNFKISKDLMIMVVIKLLNLKRKKNFMAPFFMDGVQLPQG